MRVEDTLITFIVTLSSLLTDTFILNVGMTNLVNWSESQFYRVEYDVYSRLRYRTFVSNVKWNPQNIFEPLIDLIS